MAEPEPPPLTPGEDESASLTPGSPTGSADPGPTDPGPVMITYAQTPNLGLSKEAWKAQVLAFALALRREGVDADLDQLNPDVDWNRYGPLAIQRSAVTLAVVNAAWRARWEGTNAPTEGAGAAAEAAVLQALFAEDQDAFRRRVKVVVLPGATTHDIPLVLRGPTYFTVEDFTVAGLDELLRTLTDQPAHPRPPRGTLPVLPPRIIERIEQEPAVVAAAAAMSGTGTLTVGGPAVVAAAAAMSGTGTLTVGGRAGAPAVPTSAPAGQATLHLEADAAPTASAPAGQGALHLGAGVPTPVSAEDRSRLRESAVLVDAALWAAASTRAQPARTEEGGRLRELRELLTTVLTALDDGAQTTPGTTSSQPAPPPAAAGEHLAAQLGGAEDALERVNTCWLLLAGVLTPPVQPSWDQDPSSLRQQCTQRVTSWVERSSPAVLLSNPASAVRAPGRVVFTGSSDPAHGADQLSGHWRLELGDHGEALAAANLTEHVHVPSDAGVVDSELVLPVRRDLLELWALTQVQLLVDHARAIQARPNDASGAVLHLQARLLLPAAGPPAYPFTALGLVDQDRDQDGRPTGERTPPGARPLPLSATPPATGPLTVSLAALAQPGDLVRLARRLTIALLEHFGVEDTRMLRADGTLDELAAAPWDQQAVYQHARALGLPVGDLSPLGREDLYAERLAHAREAWRR